MVWKCPLKSIWISHQPLSWSLISLTIHHLILQGICKGYIWIIGCYGHKKSVPLRSSLDLNPIENHSQARDLWWWTVLVQMSALRVYSVIQQRNSSRNSIDARVQKLQSNKGSDVKMRPNLLIYFDWNTCTIDDKIWILIWWLSSIDYWGKSANLICIIMWNEVYF